MRDLVNPVAIELVFDRTCPNVERARQMIRAALTEFGNDGAWTEWDRDDARTPLDRRHFGSPTVLVNGRDVSAGTGGEDPPADASSCRVYVDDSGSMCGAPPVTLIVAALQRSGMTR